METSLFSLVASVLMLASGMTSEEADYKGYIEAYDGPGWDPYKVCDSVPECPPVDGCVNECLDLGVAECQDESTLRACVAESNCLKWSASTCPVNERCESGECVVIPCATETCGNGVCSADCGETSATCPEDCEIPAEPVQILILNDIHAAEYTAYKTFLDSQAPDFLAVNGDLSGTGCYSLDQCKTLFEGLSYPYLFTPGNHDLENSCDGHIYDVTGNNVDVFQEKSLVTVRMDMCAIGSSGEGTFTTEDEAFLKAALDQYAGKGMNFVVLTHCHTKLTWRKYHWPVANAERMNSMLESYAPEYNKVIVIAAHEHVTYNEVTNGVLYATVGAFGLCPYEYGVLTISGTEAKFESKAWKSDSRCKYPLRHSDSAVYHTKTI